MIIIEEMKRNGRIEFLVMIGINMTRAVGTVYHDVYVLAELSLAAR